MLILTMVPVNTIWKGLESDGLKNQSRPHVANRRFKEKVKGFILFVSHYIRFQKYWIDKYPGVGCQAPYPSDFALPYVVLYLFRGFLCSVVFIYYLDVGSRWARVDDTEAA